MPMSDHHTTQTVRTALLLDFDNIFSGLTRLDEACARQFATHPQTWLTRLADENSQRSGNSPSTRRSILARYCYMNPYGPGGRHRHSLLAAGFRVMDCPPITGQGKNSADIRLVIDALDLLRHTTRFDEFIIMSGDADFVPLLVHLREHERQTMIAFAGQIASAYRGTADAVIDGKALSNLILRNAVQAAPVHDAVHAA
jgi:uncharacterized LabA/DUF88 family protein